VEYGGGWIRADHAEMTGLTKRLGIGLVPRAEITGHSYFRDGVWAATPAEDMADHQAAMAVFLADAAQMGDDTAEARLIHGLTLQAYLEHRAFPASVRREIMAWWTISGSAAPDVVGANEYVTPKLAKGLMIKLEELAFTAETGVASIAQRAVAASGAATILGDAVERLEDCGGFVRATLVSGRVVEAATALVALPLNALSQIRFSPPLLPAQTALRQQGHAGKALKLLIRAKGPKPGHLATGEAHGIRWVYADRILPDGTTLLIAFGLQDETGEPDHKTVEAVLTAAFPGAELIGFDWHDWASDPFARGTWVSPILASLPDYAAEHWGRRGRVAFAGSDLYSAEQGWMEGALLTARAAVAELETCLKRDG
jgi:monoamine oxidase